MSVINTGRAKDAELQKCLRWLCYILTVADCLLKARYIETGRNTTADVLSRSCLSSTSREKCDALIRELHLREVEVKGEFFQPLYQW